MECTWRKYIPAQRGVDIFIDLGQVENPLCLRHSFIIGIWHNSILDVGVRQVSKVENCARLMCPLTMIFVEHVRVHVWDVMMNLRQKKNVSKLRQNVVFYLVWHVKPLTYAYSGGKWPTFWPKFGHFKCFLVCQTPNGKLGNFPIVRDLRPWSGAPERASLQDGWRQKTWVRSQTSWDLVSGSNSPN